MRSAAIISLSALVLAVFFFALAPPPDVPPRAEPGSGPTAEATAPLDESPEVARAEQLEYQLVMTRELSVGTFIAPTLSLAAGMRRVSLAGRSGRAELALDSVEVFGPDGTPEASALVEAFQVARTPGDGIRLGFEPDVSPAARELLGTVASAIQFTAGEGGSWRVVEEDVNGRYEAQYRRRSATTVERTRRYIGLRTSTGFDPDQAARLNVGGTTTFEHDARGLVRVHVDEVATFDLVEGQQLRAVIELRLDRTDVARVAARAGARLTFEPPTAAPHRGDIDREAAYLGEHTAETLLAAFDELDALPPRSHEASKWRHTQLLRLRALVRRDPDSAEALARAIVDRAQDGDPVPVDLLVGALAQSQTTVGRAALIALADNRALGQGARRRIALGLGHLADPTPESSARLARMLEEGGMGSTPALALGSQARALAATEPDAAQDAVDLLVEGYLTADDPSQRRAFVGALGNAGDPRALPLLREALATPLAASAAYGLRFVPGVEADALLMGIVTDSGAPHVRAAAVSAAGFRSPTTWRPILSTLRDGEADPGVAQAIDRVLSTMPTG